MTKESYVKLKDAAGRKLTNQEWTTFLAEEFNVSNTVAKKMLHQMMSIKEENTFVKHLQEGNLKEHEFGDYE